MKNILVYVPHGRKSLESLSWYIDEEDWKGVNRINSIDGYEALEILKKNDVAGVVVCRILSDPIEEQEPNINEFKFLDILLRESSSIPRYYVCPESAFALRDCIRKKYKTEAGMDLSGFLESILV